VRFILIGLGVFVALIAIAIGGLLLYFNDGYFKERLKAAIKDGLGRESEVSAMHVSILGGSAEIEGLRIFAATGKDKDTLRCEKVLAKIDLWPLISGGAANIRNLDAELRKPEIVVDRNGSVSSIDDLIERFSKGPKGTWPKSTGLQALNFDLRIHDGSIVFADAGPLGESRAEKIELSANQASLGAPLSAELRFALVTANVKSGGTAEIKSELHWIDAHGVIDPNAFADLKAAATVANFDLPHLTRYFGIETQLNGGEFRCTLGKPLDGQLSIEAPTLAAAKLKLETSSAGIISLWKKEECVAGNLPGRLSAAADFGLAAGNLKLGVVQMELVLAQTVAALKDSSGRLLNLNLKCDPASSNVCNIAANLQGLFATDVGKALRLADRVGGEFSGTGEIRYQPDGSIKATGQVSTQNGFVKVNDKRQSMSLKGDLNADVQAKDGKLDKAQVTFNVASSSAAISSVQPLKIESLSDASKLSADGLVKIHVGGTEFWNEFRPLLSVAGLGVAVNEALDAEVRIAGSAGNIKAELNGTLKEESAKSSSPLALKVSTTYDALNLTPTADKPYLTYDINVKATQPSPLEIGLSTAITANTTQRTRDVSFFLKGALVSLTQLNKRFDEYISVLLPSDYALQGEIDQKWTSREIDQLNAQGAVTLSELKLSTDVKIAQFQLRGPVLIAGKGALAWEEPEGLELQVTLEKTDTAAGTVLKVPVAKFTSKTATLDGSIGDCDLNALEAASAAKTTTLSKWVGLLPKATVTTKISAEAIRRLNAMGLIDANLVGETTVSATYDNAAHKLNGFALDMHGAGVDAKAAAPAVNFVELAAALDALTEKKDVGAVLSALPDLDLDCKIKTPLFELLRTWKILPENAPLQGELALLAKYNRAADRLAVPVLHFARAASSKFPLASADAAFEIANVKQLLPLGADLPAKLAAHLDKGFHATNIALTPADLCACLKLSGSKDAWIEDVLAGVYKTSTVAIHAIDLTPQQAGAFSLAINAEAPVEWHPRPAAGQPATPAAAAALSGAWSFAAPAPLQVTVAADHTDIKGTLLLDRAGIAVAMSGFNYSKAAGAPLQVQFATSLDAAGGVKVSTLQIAGGPYPLTASGIVYAPPQLSLERASLTLGPQPLTISGVVYDPNKDHLKASAAAAAIDVGQLNALLKLLPPQVTAAGALVDANVTYDGKISAFDKGFKADDKFTLSATAKDVHLNAAAAGEAAALSINGRIDGDNAQLSSPGMNINIVDQAAGHPAVPLHLTFTLFAGAKTPGTLLLDSLKQPGLPLFIKLPLSSDANVNIDALIHALDLFTASSGSSAGGGAGDMSSIKALHVEGSIAAPSATIGSLQIHELKIPLTVDGPIIALTDAHMKMFGGEIIVKKGQYNMASQPLAHSTQLDLSGIDLHELTSNGQPPPPDKYGVMGRLSGSGTLSGAGFEQAQRGSWSGNFAGTIAGLVAQKNGGKDTSSTMTKVSKTGVGLLGGILGSGDSGLLSQAGRVMNIWGEDAGLFLPKLEFEPVSLNLSMAKGPLQIARSQLVGKNKSAGLQIDVAGAIDLVKEAFAPRLSLWICKLPPTTQTILRIDKLSEPDRQTILKEFSDSRFKPVVLTGSLAAPAVNSMEIAGAFLDLDNQIDRMLGSAQSATGARQPQPTGGRQSQPPPQSPADNKKKSPLDSLKDLFDK
jgi:hypothetical protein